MQTIGQASMRHGFKPLGSIRRLFPFWPARLTETDALNVSHSPAFADGPTTLAGIRKAPGGALRSRFEQIRQLAKDSEVDVSQHSPTRNHWATRRREEIFSALSPSQKIQVARHPQRPSTLDYIQVISEEWLELHGDRRGSDDQALVGGIGRIGDQPVVAARHQQRTGTPRRMWPVNFAWPHRAAIARPCV